MLNCYRDPFLAAIAAYGACAATNELWVARVGAFSTSAGRALEIVAQVLDGLGPQSALIEDGERRRLQALLATATEGIASALRAYLPATHPIVPTGGFAARPAAHAPAYDQGPYWAGVAILSLCRAVSEMLQAPPSLNTQVQWAIQAQQAAALSCEAVGGPALYQEQWARQRAGA